MHCGHGRLEKLEGAIWASPRAALAHVGLEYLAKHVLEPPNMTAGWPDVNQSGKVLPEQLDECSRLPTNQ